MLIETTDNLSAFLERNQAAREIGMDTEFVRENTYYPRLELFQIFTGRETALIDCQAVTDLEPLWTYLADPDRQKVLHAGDQDMELILQESGRLPSPIFDTQIAAGLVGLGAQCGYSRLVLQLIGKKAPKGETFSDWSRRPLQKQQLVYARKDVEYLLELKRVLYRKLERWGRLGWIEAESEHLTDPRTYQKLEPRQCYQRIRGRSGMDKQAQSVLRALAEWRELEARQRNIPPHRIIADHVLVSLAQSAPTRTEQIHQQRGMRGQEANRYAAALVATIQRGVQEATSDPVQTPEQTYRHDNDQDEGVHKILSAILQMAAHDARISPTMLATSQDLRDLMRAFQSDNLDGLPVLQDWRRELVGEKLLKALEGRIVLRIDGRSTRLILEENDCGDTLLP